MFCARLVSLVPMREVLRGGLRSIVEFSVALCCSLIFVRIFYLKSMILLCIGPY